MIADIAGIFHWPLDQLEALPADDLLFWHGKAVSWWNSHRAAQE